MTSIVPALVLYVNVCGECVLQLALVSNRVSATGNGMALYVKNYIKASMAAISCALPGVYGGFWLEKKGAG